MFKKTLIASAIMGMASAAHAIPTFEDASNAGDTLLTTYSTEGTQIAATINTGEIYVNFNVEYKEDDEITISFSSPIVGADLDAIMGSTTHDLLDLDPASATFGVKVGEITLGLLEVYGTDTDLDGNVEANGDDAITGFKLRVTQIQENGAAGVIVKTKGQQIHLTQNGVFPLSGASVRAADGASMSYSAVTSAGAPLDGGLVEGIELIAFADQFSAAIDTGFDQTIDVEVQDGDNGNGYEVDYFAGGIFPSYYDGIASFDGTVAATTVGIDVDNSGVVDGDESFTIAGTTQSVDGSSFMSTNLLTDAGSRTSFEGAGTTDTIYVSFEDARVDTDDTDIDNDGTDALFVSYVVTVTGDFTGLNNADFDVSSPSNPAGGVGVTLAADKQSLQYTMVDAEDSLLTFTENGNVLKEQSFTASVDVNYTNAGADNNNGTNDGPATNLANLTTDALVTDDDAGMWTYNGTTVDIYAVPWDAGVISQFIWLTNKGDMTVEVTASVAYTDADGNTDEVMLGKITDAAPGVTNVGKILGEKLEALTAAVAGGDSGRGTVTLVTTADRSLINVDASYKHIADKDRMRLETSQTLNERSREAAKAILIP